VEAAEAELIRLEAPDAETVGLRDALQRLVLEGRVGTGRAAGVRLAGSRRPTAP
jgi:hypothetical protein